MGSDPAGRLRALLGWCSGLALLCGCSFESTPPQLPRGGAAELAHFQVAIAGLQVYQTVLAVAVDATASEARLVPLLADKPAQLRVLLQSEVLAQPLEVQVVVSAPGSPQLEPLTIPFSVLGPSVDQDLATTPLVTLPQGWLAQQTRVAVHIQHAPGQPSLAIGAGGLPWPTAAGVSLLANTRAPVLRVAVLPLRLHVGGQTFDATPTDAEREDLAARLRALWPISGVQWQVLPSAELPGEFDPSGDGWPRALTATCAARQAFGLADNQLLYGLARPAPSLAAACQFGCRRGLAPPVAEAATVTGRCAVGVGFGGSETAETMAHELGHQLGRKHSPCGNFGQPKDLDRGYPFADGRTGTWGFDAVSATLRSPQSADFMGYCGNAWTSAYSYQGVLAGLRRL